MLGRAEVRVPEGLGLELHLADLALEGARGGVGGLRVLDAAGGMLVTQEGADVCH